ncbi:MAG: FAD-dependent oxidoreductase [Bacteroidetes bacterium]|jgi:hypothetical protein|nr:FAD-dependent oxidoreductase [Bacteroidota bacterium]
MTDFIIVGRGLAAHVLANTFYQNNISFQIIGSSEMSQCSKVAAGIWNPIVFKRLTSSWLANELVPFLNSFYNDCEVRLGRTFLHHRNIIRPFSEEQEKNLWIKKSKNELDQFLDENVQSNYDILKNCRVNGEFGFVKQCGNLDVPAFLEASELFFKEKITNDFFDHSQLIIEENGVSYKNVKARNIVFCEGYLVKNNPYFNWLPLKPAKGEIFTITAKDLSLNNHIFNKGGFILETSEGIFKSGATYEWNDLSDLPTKKGEEELIQKLENLISCNYSVVKHQAGIRPSSVDRRPLVGQHPEKKNLYVFNGLGTKGVMLAPYFANNFVLFMQQKQNLNPEVDVKRFYSLYKSESSKK